MKKIISLKSEFECENSAAKFRAVHFSGVKNVHHEKSGRVKGGDWEDISDKKDVFKRVISGLVNCHISPVDYLYYSFSNTTWRCVNLPELE